MPALRAMLTFVTVVLFGLNLFAQVQTPALEKAGKLVGTYEGTGTAFAIDMDGKVDEVATWTEKLVASNPRIDELGRAVVDVESHMQGNGWDHKMSFLEGYFVNTDGSAGGRFFVTYGNLVFEAEVAPGRFEYGFFFHKEALKYMKQEDISGLGVSIPIENVLAMKVLAEKIETLNDAGQIQDDITQKTTVKWLTPSGEERVKIFVSMKARHLKTSPL